MAKNRKTKKEKLRSNERVSQAIAQPSPDAPSEQRSVFTFVSSATSPTRHTDTIITSSHLREDLTRTGIVIFAIILAEIILFYTLMVK